MIPSTLGRTQAGLPQGTPAATQAASFSGRTRMPSVMPPRCQAPTSEAAPERLSFTVYLQHTGPHCSPALEACAPCPPRWPGLKLHSPASSPCPDPESLLSPRWAPTQPSCPLLSPTKGRVSGLQLLPLHPVMDAGLLHPPGHQRRCHMVSVWGQSTSSFLRHASLIIYKPW